MADLNKTDNRSAIDYMARDYDSLLSSMRALIPDKLPEWTGHTAEADFGNVLLELFAHMGDMLSYYQDRIANESFLPTAQTRRSVIDHLRLIGYRLATAAPAAAALQLTFPATASQVVTVRHGFAFATKSMKDRPSVRFEYLGPDFQIDCSTLIADATGRKRYGSPLLVEEGRSITGEVVGKSDGSANQRFRLVHPGIIFRAQGSAAGIHRDLQVRVELGGVIEEWTYQESLAFSRAERREFTVEIDAEDRAEVIFGDGMLGAVPASGSSVVVDYRVGGGKLGNVPAMAITTIVDAPALALAGAKASNAAPATGGSEREDIAHAVAQAPSVFRSLKRAVTTSDYEALALQFRGVGKVRAVAANWNTINLFVAPEGGGRISDVLRAQLLEYFEDKRPISTIIEVRDVDYVPIRIGATVALESYYSQMEMREKVAAAACALLAFDNVDFAQEIYLSKFYEAIEAIPGIKFVTISDFRLATETASAIEPSGKILLHDNEIPVLPEDAEGDPRYVGGIWLEVTGGY